MAASVRPHWERFGAGAMFSGPNPIGLCLEWCFLPQKSELRCVFTFPGGAISACCRIGMFPGDVFRQSGSILLQHFPLLRRPPPCPSASGGDGDTRGVTAMLEEGFGVVRGSR